MKFHPASTPSLIAFLTVVAFVVAGFLVGVAATGTRRQVFGATVGVAVWMALTAALSTQIEARLPLSTPAFFVFFNVVTIALAFSPLGTRLTRLPLAVLVAWPIFRFPLELVLHAWAEQGTIPVAMSYRGANVDIIAGVLGPLCALGMVLSPRFATPLAWLGNTVCFALLVNVGRVALLNTPGPIAGAPDEPLLLAMHVPYVWIVTICVCGALLGHLVTFRALLQRRGTESVTE